MARLKLRRASPLRFTSDGRAWLAWRWRVDQLVENADLTSRTGDDSPARVCVFFDFDASKLPFGERAVAVRERRLDR